MRKLYNQASARYASVSRLSIRVIAYLFLCSSLLLCSSSTLHAAEGETITLPHLHLQLASEISAYKNGKNFWVGILAKPEKDWHIYWRYPGDSGTSLKTDWSSSFGAIIHGPEFPIPKRIPVGPLVNFGYDSETLFLFEVEPQTNNSAEIELRVDSEWLVCQEECIPVNAILSLKIPKETGKDLDNSINQNWSEKFNLTRKFIPFDYPSVGLNADAYPDKIILSGKFPSNKQRTQISFFPTISLAIKNADKQISKISEKDFELSLSRHDESKIKFLEGILVSSYGWTPEDNFEQAINVKIPLNEVKNHQSKEKPNSSPSFLFTLILAFLGGLTLNLMPCVFPILTLKIFSLVSKKQLQNRSLHQHSFFFTTGVVLSFISMALFIVVARAGGEAIGWGFQLQSPGFVACLALLTLIVALNFLGIFELGSSLQRITGKLDTDSRHKNQNIKFLLDGILMTTLSTPCTAPFMGSALAYGLSATTLELLLVFTVLALGMATPFIALSYSSKLRSLLPKPGSWMETLKKFLSFPLFATTIWLLWVLGLQTGINTLCKQLVIFLMVAFILWIYGAFTGPNSLKNRRQALSILTLVVLVIAFIQSAFITISNKQSTKIEWEKFSATRVSELQRENRIIYVDFTAAWCITCQVNKLVAFSSDQVKSKIQSLNVATLEADWTNRDPSITEALSKFGRDGVPLNIIYSKDPYASPEILPQVLTPSIVINALERAQK